MGKESVVNVIGGPEGNKDYFGRIHKAAVGSALLDIEELRATRMEFVNSMTEDIVSDLQDVDPAKKEAAQKGLRKLIDKLFVEMG